MSKNVRYIVLTDLGVSKIGTHHFDLSPNKVYEIKGEGDYGAIRVKNDIGALQTLWPEHYRFVTIE